MARQHEVDALACLAIFDGDDLASHRRARLAELERDVAGLARGEAVLIGSDVGKFEHAVFIRGRLVDDRPERHRQSDRRMRERMTIGPHDAAADGGRGRGRPRWLIEQQQR